MSGLSNMSESGLPPVQIDKLNIQLSAWDVWDISDIFGCLGCSTCCGSFGYLGGLGRLAGLLHPVQINQSSIHLRF